MGTVRYTVVDGEILSELRDGVKRDYVPDSLGSTVALLDSSQNITDTFSYWPYGESAGRTGTTPTPFQYVGTFGYYADSFGKSYIRARYLDKSKGRWMQPDKVLWSIHSLNLYMYCFGSPIYLRDRSGFNPFVKNYCSDEDLCKKDCKDICREARKDHGIVGTEPRGRGGGVVCCNGKMCPCIFDPLPNDWEEDFCPDFDKCLLWHEKTHEPDSACKIDGFYRAPWIDDDPSRPQASECRAYARHMECLKKARNHGKPECKDWKDKIMRVIKGYLEKYCNNSTGVN